MGAHRDPNFAIFHPQISVLRCKKGGRACKGVKSLPNAESHAPRRFFARRSPSPTPSVNSDADYRSAMSRPRSERSAFFFPRRHASADSLRSAASTRHTSRMNNTTRPNNTTHTADTSDTAHSGGSFFSGLGLWWDY
ncbi:hypothetical protein C8R44DRAFT_979503 [Mycena epipterygia]|nr:hypothetical protein C8R44DRAFT_979503 [Mycena epipterygia]